MLAIDQLVKNPLQCLYFPMRRHLPEPFHAGVLERNIGIEPAGDGTVDDGLFLLVEERDQLPLGPDGATEPAVGVIEETDDGGLFGKRWKREG